ncbi:MAG: transposase [Planctomycetes bacterium]|nr:transposase [Planctomycetota bacterium]
MVLAHHLIFTAYGFWLPNDPRGSWSDFVGSWDLLRYGKATKTTTRRSVAGVPHDRELREQAKRALKNPPVQFSDAQIQAVGQGIAESARKGDLKIWACAVMSDHIHLVVARHRCLAEQIINLTKGAITRKLLDLELHPFQTLAGNHTRVPTCWAAKGWKVFLDRIEDIQRAIAYVNNNPIKEDLPAQLWDFVTPFDPNIEGV